MAGLGGCCKGKGHFWGLQEHDCNLFEERTGEGREKIINGTPDFFNGQNDPEYYNNMKNLWLQLQELTNSAYWQEWIKGRRSA